MEFVLPQYQDIITTGFVTAIKSGMVLGPFGFGRQLDPEAIQDGAKGCGGGMAIDRLFASK